MSKKIRSKWRILDKGTRKETWQGSEDGGEKVDWSKKGS